MAAHRYLAKLMQVTHFPIFSMLFLMLLFGGCTKTSGVVTDVNFHSEGLLVTKCDEILYWDLGILIVGQGNCRNDIVRK